MVFWCLKLHVMLYLDEFISKMNVWMLNDPSMQYQTPLEPLSHLYRNLLSHCIREDTIENMLICICLDMTEVPFSFHSASFLMFYVALERSEYPFWMDKHLSERKLAKLFLTCRYINKIIFEWRVISLAYFSPLSSFNSEEICQDLRTAKVRWWGKTCDVILKYFSVF